MQRPKKLLRASRACDFCHKRSIKCRPNVTDPQRCQNCLDFDVLCTYERPLKRGRALSGYNQHEGLTIAGTTIQPQQHHQRHSPNYSQQLGPVQLRPVTQVEDAAPVRSREVQNASPFLERSCGEPETSKYQPAARHATIDQWPQTAWGAFAAASAGTIVHLTNVYLQVVYPIFPLFHEPTLLQKVHDQEYLRSRSSFASLMAACALASARERDGALYNSIKTPSYNTTIASETFFAAARDALPSNLVEARDFDYMRACALLSITSIQYGDIERMQLYLGHYFTLLGIQRFHDEAYWPKNITNIEIEERRRLYWSTYTLDIYSSIVWNGSVHTHGANARVRYPTEVEDELITHLSTLPSPQPTHSWLRGWNFTTDLYLTLEHASNRLRARHAQIDDRIDVAAVFGTPVSSSAAVLTSINARYATLPSQFKTFSPPTGDPLRDIFGFQAANIQATLLLLRMLLFCTEDDGHSLSDVELKCNIAAELLAVFQTIPTAYLCGISTPLIYHLSGIGMILASVMEGPLSEPGYQKVKSILLSIADLLESLESGLSRAADISKGLRAQVERIDEYMLAQRRHMQGPYDALPINSAGASISLEQHSNSNADPDLHAVNLGNNQDHAQITATQDAGVEAEAEFTNGWLGEFQLPSELLGDWPWSFNLQPESWSLLGTGAGPREGGW